MTTAYRLDKLRKDSAEWQKQELTDYFYYDHYGQLLNLISEALDFGCDLTFEVFFTGRRLAALMC
jgi:hypothetical protein